MTKHNRTVIKRAEKARRIMKREYDAEDVETSVMDCLADLLHICVVDGYDFPDLLSRAADHERAERIGIE